MSRGGARKGAGRKATGQKTVIVAVSLSKKTAELLAAVPRGTRSALIEAVLRQAFGDSQQ